ncbi:MAG: hypothetical protein EXR69_03960 [Myxococcales bacterium]|nr:hypothetical protein [Myxococcales bacterium]
MNKIANFALFAATFALAGCGVDVQAACENYIEAYSVCASEAYAITDGSMDLDATSTCAVYDGQKGDAASASADYLQCLADAYTEGDCSSAEAYAAIDISGCTIAI